MFAILFLRLSQEAVEILVIMCACYFPCQVLYALVLHSDAVFTATVVFGCRTLGKHSELVCGARTVVLATIQGGYQGAWMQGSAIHVLWAISCGARAAAAVLVLVHVQSSPPVCHIHKCTC